MTKEHVQVRPQAFFPAWLRYLTLVLSALSFVLGVVAIFFTSKDAGAAALLAVAVALLVMSVFADRISTVEAAGIKLELLATEQLARADAAERDGRVEDAERLRESAMSLLAASNAVSERYDSLRRTMPSSWERTALLEQVIRQARQLAPEVTSAGAIAQLFDAGRDGDRASAIAIMQARPDLAHLPSLAEAVTSSRSAFEQFQALRAVDEAVKSLPEASPMRHELIKMVRDAMERDTMLRSSTDRLELAKQIVRSDS